MYLFKHYDMNEYKCGYSIKYNTMYMRYIVYKMICNSVKVMKI